MAGALGSLLRGALAGLAATAAMSAVMVGRKKHGKLGRMPQEKIVRGLLDRAGLERPSRPVLDALALGSHLAYGAGTGGLYSAVHRRLGSPVGVVDGMVYGLLVWAASYAGWIPALGIMRPPHRDRQHRPTTMILSHLVYGGVLGALAGRGGRRPRRADVESPYLR